MRKKKTIMLSFESKISVTEQNIFVIAGRRLSGELHQELFHRVRPDCSECDCYSLQDSPSQRLRQARRRGTKFTNIWHERFLSFFFQVCSTQYESECITEQEVHQVFFLTSHIYNLLPEIHDIGQKISWKRKSGISWGLSDKTKSCWQLACIWDACLPC